MFNFIRSGRGTTVSWIASAIVVGTVLGQLFATWLSLCGTSPVSLAALAVGFAAGVVLADWAVRFVGQASSQPLSSRFVGQASSLPTDVETNLPQNTQHEERRLEAHATAPALVALCWLTPVLMNATLLAGCETIGAGWPLSSMLIMLFPAIVVAIVTACAGVFFRAINPRPEVAWINSALVGSIGAALVMVNVWCMWPLAVVSSIAVCFAVLSRLLVHDTSALRVWLGKEAEPRAIALANTPSSPGAPGSATFFPYLEKKDLRESGSLLIHFAAVGVLIVAVSEIMTRLMPGSLPLMLATVSIAASGLLLLTHPRTIRVLTHVGMNTISLLTLAAVPMLFAILADLNLSINTGVNSPFVILLLRAVQCAMLLIAALIPAVSGAIVQRGSGDAPSSGLPATFSPCQGRRDISERVKESTSFDSQRFGTRTGAMAVLPATIGVVLSLAAVARGVSPAVVLGCGIVLHAMAAFTGASSVRSLVRLRTLSPGRLAVPAMAIIGPVLVLAGGFDSAHMSSLLFSDRTMAAVQRGVTRDLIPQSDVNRLVTVSPMSDGEITIWRRAGNVFEFQRNGMSLGRISSDTTLSPQPVEEILPAILAMVSHPQPGRVLLLGDDTGACLRTCSHFPVQEIVAVRNDRRLTELARRFTWSSLQTPPDQDDRVKILHESPLLTLRRRELKSFDVVISSTDGAASASAASQYTTEFYQCTRSRMSDDGIFCQRFRLQHLGAEPLKAAMSTLMTSFRHVGAVQTVPGEILLLATNADKGLIDPEILTRLQRDHVRREIATAGWDWSQVAVFSRTNGTTQASESLSIRRNRIRPKPLSL